MVEVALWFMGIGLAVVVTQFFAGLYELTLVRRAGLQVIDVAYERETLWGTFYGFFFHVFYLATLAGYGLFYWELRQEVYAKQWAGVVCVMLIIMACTLHPQKNMSSKKYYWNVLGWVSVIWVAFMGLRAVMATFAPGVPVPFPLP